jgi:hypothetical protein
MFSYEALIRDAILPNTIWLVNLIRVASFRQPAGPKHEGYFSRTFGGLELRISVVIPGITRSRHCCAWATHIALVPEILKVYPVFPACIS